jgi:DNA uptake protein ComE-like DNA-binding protein
MLGPDGQTRLDLMTAKSSDVVNVTGADDIQSAVIVAYVQNAETLGTTPTMEDFISTTPAQMAQTLRRAGVTIDGLAPNANTNTIRQLNDEQLASLYDFCAVDVGAEYPPGRLNLNTADDEVLEYLSTVTPEERDAIILFREQGGGQIASVIDMLQIPQMTRTRLAVLAKLLTTESTVFTISSRGHDATSGLEVEMIAEVERSAWPMTVRSLTVR